MSDAEFERGRYLYCAVLDPDPGPDSDPGSNPESQSGADEEFSVAGVDDEPTRLIVVDGLGVVVHDCDGLYDTDEMDVLRKWLLQHQQVIDAAGERFGTPLPFRFDTIIQGGDERVREWVDEQAAALERHLDALSGLWEYHVQVTVEEADLEADLEAEDPQLRDLADRIEGATNGTGFLLERQYDQRLAELKRARRVEQADRLERRLADLAREVHRQDSGGGAIDDEELSDEPRTYPLARLTMLAHEDREEAIGDVLDDVAARPGVSVRFTGPWPPYTFAPELGGADADDADDIDTRREGDRAPD